MHGCARRHEGLHPAGVGLSTTAAPMTTFLANSPRLVPSPPVDPAYAAQLDPRSFTSWEEMFEAHSETLHFLLKPGDYRPWGVLSFVDNPGLGDDRPRTMRYYNVEDQALHPVKRRKAATVDSLQFAKDGTRNWFVQGLTISAPSANPGTNEGPSNITVDYCLIEDFGRYGFRIRNTTNCTVQRCVIRESRSGTLDSSGIQVKGQREWPEVVEIRILDNEIYNVGDGIQITPNLDHPSSPIEVLIEGNDLYLEPSRYIGDNTTLDENAIDVKAGSDRPESTVIRNNRMWGMRHSARTPPESQGELLVLQKYCRNAVIEGNILGDAPRGMKDEVWPGGAGIDVRKKRDIVIRNNEFYAIRDYAEVDKGAVTKPITSCLCFLGNHFARSSFLVDVGPAQYGSPPPKFTGNVRAYVGKIQRKAEPGAPAGVELPFDEVLNPAVTARFGFENYERKRWTGPEFAQGAVPRPTPWWRRLLYPPEWPLLGPRLRH